MKLGEVYKVFNQLQNKLKIINLLKTEQSKLLQGRGGYEKGTKLTF